MKRPVGRPPSNPSLAVSTKASSTGTQVTSLPRPPKSYFNSKQAKGFFDYWKGIPEDKEDAATIYVYRRWPVINRQFADPTAVKTIDKLVGKSPFQNDDFEGDIAHRYGEGDYRFFMNEGSAQITRCDIQIRNDQYPPLVDPRELVQGDPLNAGFIQSLRMRGVKLPGDAGYGQATEQTKQEEEESEEMKEAGAAAITVLSDIARDAMNDKRRPDPEPRVSGAETAGLTLISNAAQSSMKMVQDTAASLLESRSTQNDPFVTVTAIMGLVDKLKPAPVADTTTPLLEKMFTLFQSEMAATRREMAELRNTSSNRSEEGTGQLAFIDQLKQMKEMKELTTEMFGGGEPRRKRSDDDDDEDDDRPRRRREPESLVSTIFKSIGPSLPTLIQNGMMAITAFQTITHNLAVAKSGQGQPIAPTAPAASPQQSNPSATGLNSGPAPLDPEAEAFLATQPPEDAQVIRHVVPYISTLEAPFLKHFFDENLGGEYFAEFLINSAMDGRKTYEQISSMGKEALLKILHAHTSIWRQVQSLQPKLDLFLDRFVNHDALMEEGDEGEETEGEGDEVVQ